MNVRTLQLWKAQCAVLFTLLLSVAGVTNATAQSFTVGDLTYSINNDGVSVTLTGHVNGISGQLVIPESVELYGTTYPVTAIGNSAFSGCTGLSGSLVIPNSVITIGSQAFYACTGLNGSLTIGDAVQSINYRAFYACYGLSGALTIPENVTSIEFGAFEACYGFTILNYNATNCYLGYSNGKNWLGGEYSSMTTLNIGENIQVIPANFLKDCSSFTGELVIPQSVTTIQNSAFEGCSGFTGSLTIPNTVTAIGNSAFMNCTGFSDTLTLGRSLTEIDYSAFFGSCEGFTSFIVWAETPPNVGLNAFANVNQGIPVYVPCSTLGTYQSSSFWNSFSNLQEFNPCIWEIIATVTPIMGGTVSGAGLYEQGQTCTLLAIPNEGFEFINWMENGVEISTDEIITFAVSDNRNLVAHFHTLNPNVITFADLNVENICVANWDTDGDGALSYEEAAAVTDLGYAFYDNQSITSFDELQYFTGLTAIGYDAFQWCNNLASILIPEEVTAIEEYAFYRCSSLTSVSIPDGVVTIGICAFSRCYNLTSVNIPEAVVSIGESAFYSCGLRGELTLPESLESVGQTAFYGCDGISMVNYNAINCQTMGSTDYPVFYNCAFTHLNIGENVQSIPNFAFKRCFMITDMTVATANPPTIYPSTFGMVPRSIPVVVPNGSGDAYRSAQYWEEFFNIIEGTFDNTQISPLAEGWNWWSSYIELTDNDGLSQLENSIGSAGMIIKSRSNGYVEAYPYNGGTSWYGTLSSINNEQMYKIRTNAACNAIIVGDLASPANHPITINSGWNWIGFPCNQNVGVDVALSGFTPANNDIIKGRNGYTTYYSDANYSMWYGTLNTLESGKGYMYRSNSSTPKTLTFQTGRGETAAENITSENNHYRPNSGSYADNMTLAAVLELDGEELRSEDYELAAFVGDECRGSVRLMYVEPLDRYMAFLTVFGEQSETLSFRLTDGTQSSMSSDDMAYVADGVAGTMTEPVTLRFGTLNVDENEALNVVVYPNPSDGVFNIQGQGIRKIEVFNSYGQIVLSEEISDDYLQIDLGSCAKGIYMLRVITDKGMAQKQIIKH